ncbi:hypothetical protein [Thiocystis violacea]|uniref:hypothetical protein n=1 Tax=Thiocystis violacea TaxID=13725 RepID=UPI00190530FA|nr:hypothetical protein [Thiocystis violacea]
MNILTKLSVVLLSTFSVLASAEEWYAGTTFISSGDSDACVIVRFKAGTDFYTLSQADGLYSTITSLLTDQDLGDVTLSHITPSQNHEDGISGESLANYFLSNGTAVCTMGGQSVDAVGFISTFPCEYQNENQMCFRLYVDTGELDLTMIGIPQAPAALGGVFIKREVWNAVYGLISGNSGSLPFGMSRNDMGEEALSGMLEPMATSLRLILPGNE